MARYIDADRFAERIKLSPAFKNAGFEGDLLQRVVLDLLDNAPTADIAEVKHGEWQRQNGGFFFLCSVCGKAAATKGNYCHNCGAKMNTKEK